MGTCRFKTRLLSRQNLTAVNSLFGANMLQHCNIRNIRNIEGGTVQRILATLSKGSFSKQPLARR